MPRKIGSLHGGLQTLLIITCKILVRMRHVSEKSYRENQNTHIMANMFFVKNCAFMGYSRKNKIELDRAHMTI